MDRAPLGGERAIEIHDLGIRYDLRLMKRTTLKGSLAGMLRRNTGTENHFWALCHFNLSLDHGESLAVIGPILCRPLRGFHELSVSKPSFNTVFQFRAVPRVPSFFSIKAVVSFERPTPSGYTM